MTQCECGAEFTQPPGKGRRRKRCETCSPKRVRPSRRAPVLALAGRLPAPQPARDGQGRPGTAKQSRRETLTARTLTELVAVGREESWQGESALKAAELVDAGGYTAQGAAALLKAHREALFIALEGAGAQADVIDLIFGAEA